MVENAWFLRPCPRPDASVRLCCFPSAGAGASAYVRWAHDLPEAVEVRPLQLPGRESRMREAPFTRCPDLAEAVADQMETLLDRPYAFFGHSMGALAAFESVRALRRRGLQAPTLLVVSSRPAPQLPKSHPPIYRLPKAEFVAELERLFAPPRGAWDEPELMEILLPTLRADMTVCDTYEYEDEPPLSCPIYVMGGDRDPTAPVSALDGWREQTESSFHLRLFPGGHFYLRENDATCLRLVSEALGKAPW